MAADPSAPGPSADDLPDPATLGYEQARDELAGVVAALETGTAPLERSLALWERGEALAGRCEQLLEGARERLDRAVATDGERGGGRDDEGSTGR